MEKKGLIFIPTYNERDNLASMIERITRLKIQNVEILIIDDNSTDGTSLIADKLATANYGLHVIHREKKSGIGSAHLAALEWAYSNKYRYILTMDCDFTHLPEAIPLLLVHLPAADLVLANRFLQKDSLKEWSLQRKMMTWLSHNSCRLLLGIPYDPSNAFRVYNLENIPERLFGLVTSKGYTFFMESLYILSLNIHNIAEVPVSLPRRVAGESKMKLRDVINGIRFLFYLFGRRLFFKQEYLLQAGNNIQKSKHVNPGKE